MWHCDEAVLTGSQGDRWCLVAQVTITAAQGGHSGPVQVLLPFGQFLLSADWLGTLKLWDMASGQCVQTMQQAHKEPIMGVLQWEVSPPSPSPTDTRRAPQSNQRSALLPLHLTPG